MKALKILQVGLQKSGNLWVHRLLKNIILESDMSYDGFILQYRRFIEQYPIHDLTRSFAHDVIEIGPSGIYFVPARHSKVRISDFDEYLNHCYHVWSHSMFCEYGLNILPKFDRIMYIIRDPRDVVISASRYAYTPGVAMDFPQSLPNQDSWLTKKFVSLVSRWVERVGGYLKQKDNFNIHFIFYERLLQDFDAELSDLLAYLNIELDSETIDKIKQAVSFKELKETKPEHLRKGKSNQWVKVLTELHKEQAAQIAGPMLDLLNYPANESEINGSLPSIPKLPINELSEKIDTALTNAGQFRKKQRQQEEADLRRIMDDPIMGLLVKLRFRYYQDLKHWMFNRLRNIHRNVG